MPAWMAFDPGPLPRCKASAPPRKAFTFGLLAGDYRNCQIVPREALIDAEHFHCLGERLGLSLMRGVTLLPEELSRPKEQAGPQLPANNIRPLIKQHGQVAPRLDPARVGCADDRL